MYLVANLKIITMLSSLTLYLESFKHDDPFLVNRSAILFLALCLVSKEKLIPGLSDIIIESFKNLSCCKFKNNYNAKLLNTLS